MKIITFTAFLAALSLASSAQLPSLGKAKSLFGSKANSNSGSSSATTPPGATQGTTNNSAPASNGNSTAGTDPKTGNTKNSGKPTPSTIYFSSTSFSTAKQGSATTEFKDGDMIYARVDFPAAMQSMGDNMHKYSPALVIKCDGHNFNGQPLQSKNDSLLQTTYFEFQLISSASAAKFPLVKYFTKAFADNLIIGKHTIDVLMTLSDYSNNSVVIAQGTITLDYSDGKKKLQDFAHTFDPPKHEITKVDRMPKAAMRNAAIEKDLMNAIGQDFEEPITPLRAVIDVTDWSIVRDDYNVILRRVIGGYVAFKVPRNGRCFYKYIEIFQPYTGGGTYGKSQYYDRRVNADLMEIDCANVMK